VRILINALSARRGGGQTYLIQLLNHLDQFPEIEVKLLASPLLQVPVLPQVEVVRVNWPTENPVARFLWERFALKNLVRKLNCQVLFCPGGSLFMSGRFFATAVTFQNMLPFSPEQISKYSWLSLLRFKLLALRHILFLSMKRADLIIFISEFAKNQMEKLKGGAFKKCVVIPHGISAEFCDSTKSLPAPHVIKTPYLLYVSIFEPYKQQVEVVYAFKNLIDSNPSFPFQLVLAGKNDLPYGRKVKQLIAQLNLKERVILPGNIPYQDLPSFFKNAAVNIFASDCENCPNILLEAMAAGQPLACSSTEPMPEFAKGQATYFDCHDPESIAQAILKSLAGGKPTTLPPSILSWRKVAFRTWESLYTLGKSPKAP